MRRRRALAMLGLGATAALATGLGKLGQRQSPAAEAFGPRPEARAIRVFYMPAYAGSAHAFETTRKARWVAESLSAEPIPGIALAAHASLTETDLLLVHEPAYVSAVRTGVPRELAESQGFAWDPELWPMVLASNGGVHAAAVQARRSGVAGALSSGLHHARRERGLGFCTFNGLAIAALRAMADGVRRVLVIDLDAHCGGGTHSLLGANPGVRLMDVAVDGFDHYQPLKPHTLDVVRNAKDYLATIQARLLELQAQAFDLCLYNAGMDPHQHCPVGGLAGVDQDVLATREQMVFSWCRQRALPVAFVLAGGYLGPRLDQAGLIGLHRLTLAAATRA